MRAPSGDSASPTAIEERKHTKSDVDSADKILGTRTGSSLTAEQKPIRKIRLGICCVEKKLSSRPMKAILDFLGRNPEIEILRFNDVMLLE